MCNIVRNAMAVGTVKFFDGEKGFGFIIPEGGGKDVFVHTTAVELAGLPLLVKGDRFSFELEQEVGGTVKAIRLQPQPTIVSAVGVTDMGATPAKRSVSSRTTKRMAFQASSRRRGAKMHETHVDPGVPNNSAQWQRGYERYRILAQNVPDDLVTREHYWQHAEHFRRLINGSSN
jgi:cold shock protein